MNVCWTRNAIAAFSLGAAIASAFAAPVVPTPGSAAGYSFFPPAQSTSTTGAQETLVTCYVSPGANRTLVMSGRNWYGYTKPINVYYKMVGGGASPGRGPAGYTYPQLGSAGGSSAILKNGTLVAAASGMSVANIASPPTVVAGMFTVSNTDTVRFVSGGGGGGSYVYAQYTGVWNYYGVPGGGGAGYYGGGAGARQDWYGTSPVAGAAVATGGTGTAGGAGAAAGGLGVGGSTAGGAGGGNGAGSGTDYGAGIWNGYMVINYTSGGGGGYGAHGSSGGETQYCPGAPVPGRSMSYPLATTFDLDPTSGTSAGGLSFADGYGNWTCWGGGGRGEIVLQYQAPTCDIIPQWNQP